MDLCFLTKARYILLGVLGMFLFFSGCSQKAPPAQTPPPQVEIITVTTRTVPDEPEFIGQTQAFRPVEIRPQVTGIIKELFFTEGRNVKKGDKLYLIDPVPFRAAYLSSNARVAQAQARLIQAQQEVPALRKAVEELHSQLCPSCFWQREHLRSQRVRLGGHTVTIQRRRHVDRSKPSWANVDVVLAPGDSCS